MSVTSAYFKVNDDQYVEVTPKSLRLRKKILSSTERRKAERAGKA